MRTVGLKFPTAAPKPAEQKKSKPAEQKSQKADDAERQLMPIIIFIPTFSSARLFLPRNSLGMLSLRLNMSTA